MFSQKSMSIMFKIFYFKCPALSYVHVKQAKHPQLTVVVKYFTILILAIEKNYEKKLKIVVIGGKIHVFRYMFDEHK